VPGQAGSLPRPPLTVELDSELADPGQLVVFRRRLRRWTEMHRIGGNDAQAILIAVGEAVTDALKHGAPPVRVLGWTSGGLARAQVHDRGLPANPGHRRLPAARPKTRPRLRAVDHPPAR
jgi:anti-sigma regulatory factor (Ser/Thr protein kinase)